MRINYSEEDEDFDGQFELWRANCRRSIKGKKGQAELRALRDALLALPEKRLIHGLLVDDAGGVCAIGAYARSKGIDLTVCDPEEESDEVGVDAGMPPMVAWRVVEMNDIMLDHCTEEGRYIKMLRWIESQLVKETP